LVVDVSYFRAAKEAPPKELESKVPHKDIPKEDKH
jgi:hypothetical protein